MVSQDGSDLSGRKEKHSWKTFSLLFLGQFDVTLAAEKRRRGNWSTRSDKGQNGRDPCHFPYVFFPPKDISCFESCVCRNVARKLHRKLLHADPVSWFSSLFFSPLDISHFQEQNDLKGLLDNLHQNIQAKKRKNVEIMWLAATVSTCVHLFSAQHEQALAGTCYRVWVCTSVPRFRLTLSSSQGIIA